MKLIDLFKDADTISLENCALITPDEEPELLVVARVTSGKDNPTYSLLAFNNCITPFWLWDKDPVQLSLDRMTKEDCEKFIGEDWPYYEVVKGMSKVKSRICRQILDSICE